MERLYYLSSSQIPSQKANSIQVMKMCQAFSKHFEKVFLFAVKTDEKTNPFDFYKVSATFEIKLLKRPKIKFINKIIYAIKVLRELWLAKAGGVIFSRDVFSTGLLSFFYSRNFTIFFEAHAPPSNILRKWVLKRIFLNSNFSKLVTISGALKKEYLRLYPDLSENKIVVAHDGADLSQIPESMINPTDFNLKGKKLKLGYIGSLYPGKGAEIILEVATLLPQFEFHIVGGSKNQINEIKKNISLDNVFFHGFVNPEKIYFYMDQFDVMLAPYQSRVIVGSGTLDISKWMSPLKLFEYMGGGKPIIASDLPVLKEVIKENENALLADPKNPNDWVEKINMLHADIDLRCHLGINAQKDLINNYSWDKRSKLVLSKGEKTQHILPKL